MECPFQTGDKVVCKLVKISEWAESLNFECPVVGGVYTVRAVNAWPNGSILLRFEELHNEHLTELSGRKIEPGFPYWYFEPVIPRSIDKGMSILRGLLDSKTTDQPVKVTA